MARNRTGSNTTVQEDAPPIEGGTAQVGGTQIAGLDSIPKGDPVADKRPPAKATDATERLDGKEAPKVVAEKYVVLRQHTLLEKGFRSTLPEGKIIDASNYDIKKLKRMGVKLRPADDED